MQSTTRYEPSLTQARDGVEGRGLGLAIEGTAIAKPAEGLLGDSTFDMLQPATRATLIGYLNLKLARNPRFNL